MECCECCFIPPGSIPVAERGRRTCLQMSARALAHSHWACPHTVQASLAVTAKLSAGLCHAEAQRITLLATVTRLPTPVATRQDAHKRSALHWSSVTPQARASACAAHQPTLPVPCSYAGSHCVGPSMPCSTPRATGCTTTTGVHCRLLAGAAACTGQSNNSAELDTLAAILLIAVSTERP